MAEQLWQTGRPSAEANSAADWAIRASSRVAVRWPCSGSTPAAPKAFSRSVGSKAASAAWTSLASGSGTWAGASKRPWVTSGATWAAVVSPKTSVAWPMISVAPAASRTFSSSSCLIAARRPPAAS